VYVITALFDQVWFTATPLGDETRNPDGIGLRAAERQILRMLAEGLTDEMISRRIGVSVRTVRRTIAELSERLKAGSRFQAGVLAQRAGWL
jgi:DNA-binding NarL/FixJ family response regulator